MSLGRPSLSAGPGGPARPARTALAIMLKAPESGRVKTRLTPPLSSGAAADLSRCMIRDTAENIAGVCRTADAAGAAVYTPAGAEAAIAALVPSGFARIPQRGEAFGERLAHAAADLFAAGFQSICLIDSDSPTLPAATLAGAVQALGAGGDRVVIAGADDGGYCLIGLSGLHLEVFENIEWSTSRVHQQTIDRARAAGLAVTELAAWYDVDDRASLARLCRDLLGGRLAAAAGGAYAAPHTRQFLLDHLDDLEAIGAWRAGVEADAR